MAPNGNGVDAVLPTIKGQSSIFRNNANISGGGIENSGGQVTIEGFSLVHENKVVAASGDPGKGGGIFNMSTAAGTADLTIDGSSKVEGNLAFGDLDEPSGQDLDGGGGIYNDRGMVKIKGGSIVSKNLADGCNGGGVFNINGDITIDGGFVNDNGTVLSIHQTPTHQNLNPTVNGGGIYSYYDGTPFEGAFLTITNSSSVQDNNAQESGGGIYNNTGTAYVRNGSRVDLNTALGIGDPEDPIGGGGIYNTGGVYIQSYSFVHSNKSLTRDGGGIYNTDGGGVLIEDGVTVFFNEALLGRGGGVYADATTLNGGEIKYNHALPVLGSGGGVYKTSLNFLFNAGDITLNTPDDIVCGLP